MHHPRKHWWLLIFALILLAIFVLNLLAAFGPEIEWDALWYHLTLPEIYAQRHVIRFLPGQSYYYSALPRLIEMHFTLALVLANPVVAKLLHYLFGVFFGLSIYAFARHFFGKRVGFWASFITLTMLEVVWLFKTAYIDLGSGFYGTLALYSFFLWLEDARYHRRRMLLLSAILFGLALSTKIWILVLFPIFVVFILWRDYTEQKKLRWKLLTNTLQFCGLALLIVLPWYIDSFINTGNPFYPLGAFSAPEHLAYAGTMTNWLTRVYWTTMAPYLFDFIVYRGSPFFILLLAVPFFWKRFTATARKLSLFGILAIVLFAIIPTRIVRYQLPSVAAIAIPSALVIAFLLKKKVTAVLVILFALFVGLTQLWYVYGNNNKYMPVVLGKQSEHEWLSEKMAMYYPQGFYDSDNFYATHFAPGDMVLMDGVAHLFYVDFPHIEESEIGFSLAGTRSTLDVYNRFHDQGFTHLFLKSTAIETFYQQHGGEEGTADRLRKVLRIDHTDPKKHETLYRIVIPKEDQ